MAVKFLDLYQQYRSIRTEIDQAIASVITDCAFISGSYAARFEESFAAYQQADHCIGCANGTDAIEIAIESLGLPVGSEILVPANTFIASAEAVTRAGHRVVFCDCDPHDYTISTESIARKLTPRTSAVLAVHLYGQPCEMDSILDLALRRGVKVIEDCAQAHGAEFRGRRVGSFGDIGTFSFYPGKNLGAYGDGGALVTKDATLARRARMIANHGRIGKYDHEFEGRNSRLDGLQAAILSVKLSKLESWIEQRRAIAARYQRSLEGVGDLVLPKERLWGRHVYHLYVVRTRQRDALQAYLGKRGIETGIHYPVSLPKLKAYAYCGQMDEPLLANRLDAELLSLPIGDHMTLGDATEVAQACVDFFN